jgi:hypothetical protein
VWARDLVTGKNVKAKVIATMSRTATAMMAITVAGAALTVTTEHPFHTNDRGWVQSDKLKTGDVVDLADGGTARIENVARWDAPTTVYNFTVKGEHNYFVGADGVLVHNAVCNLDPGHSPAAARGQAVHNGPEWGEHLDSLGYQRSGPIDGSELRPDGFTAGGAPVELKPATRSGIRAGTRQLRKYMREMDTDYGELWTYSDGPDGVAFSLSAVPRAGTRFWQRW